MPEQSEIRKRTIVVFSGAGLSAESGIPTFRDSNGLWEHHRVEEVASPGGWRRDPALVLRFYELRFRGVQAAQPNEAHRSIARLQAKFNVLNITQNIDDLLERAGCENVVHLHGLIIRRKCEFHRDIFGDGGYTCDFKAHQDAPVQIGDLCPKCGGQLRPDVVWFGEAVNFDFDQLSVLVDEVDRHDGVFICIGTSAQVAPASHLIPVFNDERIRPCPTDRRSLSGQLYFRRPVLHPIRETNHAQETESQRTRSQASRIRTWSCQGSQDCSNQGGLESQSEKRAIGDC